MPGKRIQNAGRKAAGQLDSIKDLLTQHAFAPPADWLQGIFGNIVQATLQTVVGA